MNRPLTRSLPSTPNQALYHSQYCLPPRCPGFPALLPAAVLSSFRSGCDFSSQCRGSRESGEAWRSREQQSGHQTVQAELSYRRGKGTGSESHKIRPGCYLWPHGLSCRRLCALPRPLHGSEGGGAAWRQQPSEPGQFCHSLKQQRMQCMQLAGHRTFLSFLPATTFSLILVGAGAPAPPPAAAPLVAAPPEAPVTVGPKPARLVCSRSPFSACRGSRPGAGAAGRHEQPCLPERPQRRDWARHQPLRPTLPAQPFSPPVPPS